MFDDLAFATALLFSVLFAWALGMAWLQSTMREVLRG
jgi:hypothetical protein